MRRLFALLTLLVVAPAASGSSAADWKKLKYFEFTTQRLLVTTDGSWEGGNVVGSKYQKPLPIPGPGLGKTQPNFIWTTTCGSPQQFVSFSKKILAPGDPVEGSLNFTLGFGRDLPFRSGTYLVNGVEVARLVVEAGRLGPKYFSGPVPAKALKAFRYGTNTLTIRAERKALKKGEACNSPNRLIGVLANLSLTFKPDMVAVPSSKGLEQAVRAAPGQVSGALGAISFVNAGPSGSPGGKFVFSWAASGAVETAFTANSFSGGPFTGCTGEGLNTGTIECEYADFEAGKRATITVIAGARATATFSSSGTAILSMSWQIVPAGYDVNGANNATSHTIVLCGATATDPRCAKAK